MKSSCRDFKYDTAWDIDLLEKTSILFIFKNKILIRIENLLSVSRYQSIVPLVLNFSQYFKK